MCGEDNDGDFSFGSVARGVGTGFAALGPAGGLFGGGLALAGQLGAFSGVSGDRTDPVLGANVVGERGLGGQPAIPTIEAPTGEGPVGQPGGPAGGTVGAAAGAAAGTPSIENQLNQIALDIANEQLGILRQQRTQQEEGFSSLNQLFAELQGQQAEQLQSQQARAAALDPLIQEATEIQLERLKKPGKPTEAELANITEALGAAGQIGRSNILDAQRTIIAQIKNELAPGRGLRPSDTQFINLGAEVGEQSLRQIGQLERQLAGVGAQARLDLPLAQQRLASGILFNQQQTQAATRKFQEQLRSSAFSNRMALQGAQSQAFTPLLGVSPAAQATSINLGTSRTNLALKPEDSGFNFGGLFSGVGGLFSGLGELGLW
jgi:hypothetical protein